MSCILITAIGSFSADIVIKEMKSKGHYVIGCDIYPKNWNVDALNVDLFVQAPYYSDDNYISFIEKLCITYKVDYILPLTDPETLVLTRHKAEFKQRNITVCSSNHDVVLLCNDKYSLSKFLAKHEVCKVIPTILLNEVNPVDIKYPCYAKPRGGRSSEGCMRIDDEIDLEYILKKKNGQEYIIQPYIDGTIVTVDVVRHPLTKDVACVSRRELIRTKNGAGITVEMFEDNALSRICSKIAELVNVTGAVNIEFIETKNKEYFLLEINPRFSAGIEFTHMAGYPIVSEHMKCFENTVLEQPSHIRNVIIGKKYEEYIIWEENNEAG